mgnify:CR=1 FL=1
MKKVIYFIEYIIIYILFIIFRIIGYKNSSNLGYLIGKKFGPLFRPVSKIKNNLVEAKIDEKNNLGLIANNVLGNYGRIFSEYVFIKLDLRDQSLTPSVAICSSQP